MSWKRVAIHSEVVDFYNETATYSRENHTMSMTDFPCSGLVISTETLNMSMEISR
jgi:hypothetical protein